MVVAFVSVCAFACGLLTLLVFGAEDRLWPVGVAFGMVCFSIVFPALATAANRRNELEPRSMIVARASARAAFLAWALAVCPAIGWYVAWFLVAGRENDDVFWSTTFGLPVLLAVAGGVLLKEAAGWIVLGALLTLPGSFIALWATLWSIFG